MKLEFNNYIRQHAGDLYPDEAYASKIKLGQNNSEEFKARLCIQMQNTTKQYRGGDKALYTVGSTTISIVNSFDKNKLIKNITLSEAISLPANLPFKDGDEVEILALHKNNSGKTAEIIFEKIELT